MSLRASGSDIVFYDGTCGLCHGFVRFVLAQERSGDSFGFAPLQGETFRTLVPEAERSVLPDSIVVRTAKGRLLTRSDAVLHVARRLGGRWRALAAFAALVPRPVRDLLYDAVARVRYRLFRRPAEVCPLVPKHLRARFLA